MLNYNHDLEKDSKSEEKKKEGKSMMNLDSVRVTRQTKRNKGNGDRIGLYAVFTGEEAVVIREAARKAGIQNLSEFARHAVVAELRRAVAAAPKK